MNFLFPNITSICQFLDQRIIKVQKALYKKKQMHFLYNKYYENKDPLKIINVF